MPVTVNHQLTATTPDDPLFEIKPSNWNSEHAVTINAVGSEISGAFGNGGGVTFGLSADGKITASAPAGGGGLTNINVSAGTTSNNLSALTFSNGSGVSFGLNGSVITASVQTNYLTTAMASNRGTDFVQATAAFAGTNASGTIASNGISVSVGNYITTARASNDAVGLNTALTAGPLAWTVNSSGISLNASNAAGTTSGFGGNLISGSMTHNTAGLNLSLNHPAWLTTAMQSNAATISNIRVSAGTTSNLLSALTFSNSNGVSFGINGSTMTASHNGLTTARASNDGVGLNTAQSNVTWSVNSAGISLDARGYAGTGFTGTNATATLNSNGLQLSVAGGGVINQTGPNISAGTDSLFTSGTVTFGNAFSGSFVTSNGSVVYSNAFLTTAMASNRGSDFVAATAAFAGTNASGTIASNGISVSVNAGGAAQTYSGLNHYNDLVQVAGQAGQGTLQFDPMRIENYVQFDRFCLPVINTNSSNSSGSHTLSFWIGLYTRTSNTLSLYQSVSATTALTHSGTVGSYSLYSGIRLFTIPFTTTLPPNDYWVGFLSRTTTGGANGTYSNLLASNINSNFLGMFGSSHNTTYQLTIGQGVYSATTSSIPGSVGFTQIRGSDSAALRAPVVIMAYSTV